MGILDRLRGREKQPPMDRRDFLLKHGRIVDGEILDLETAPDGTEMLKFIYTLNGVDFESSDALTPEQKRDIARYSPGAAVGIRYDPKNQYNSIVE